MESFLKMRTSRNYSYSYCWLSLSFLFFCSVNLNAQSVLAQQPAQQQQQDGSEHIFYNLDSLLNHTLKIAREEFQAEDLHQLQMSIVTKPQARRFHQSVKFTATTEEIGRASNINLRAYQLLTEKYGVAKRPALKLLERNLIPFCAAQQKYRDCDVDTKYRTIDGTCNNIKNPYWGASFTAFHREVPASYRDGYNEPRGGRVPSALPNARLVSTTVHPDVILPDAILTNMVGQFGQFVDHDLTLTPEGDKMCCDHQRDDVDCWNINIYSNDSFYSTHGQTCMEFTRSTPFCFPTSTGIREQMNILTAYADASNVYGSETVREKQLREYRNGRLRVSDENSNMLPTVAQVENIVGDRIEFMGLFLAGDERVNEMPALTVMHNLWVREHNRVADEIKELRPDWSDEIIFQEARRIVIAEWQNVLYGEYLPIILGPKIMREYNLDLGSPDSFSVYNPKVNATISHAFATAAYRFGHTLINGIVRLIKRLQPVGSYKLRDHYFDASQIMQNNGDGYNLILEGLATQSSQVYDPFVTEELTNFLLKKKEYNFGGDLIARNLQRGREHGLQGYNAYRAICGLPSVTSWENPPAETTLSAWNKLQDLYSTPQEIDLFTGGLIERSVPGGLTGPTFNCLKALQFNRLKFGDRFFFTHKDQTGSFSRAQLVHLRSRRFSDVICDNSNLEFIPSSVFYMVNPNNPLISCTRSGRGRNTLNVSLLLDDL